MAERTNERVKGTSFRDTEAPSQIWSFRGYRLAPSEFNNAMIHFYRAEVSRANTWRARLDTTTNWAVVTTGAALSFTFSDPAHTHVMIPLTTILVALFLLIEARRYRYYDLWSYRIRLMETNFFAAMLAPPFQPSESWAQHLTETLLRPKFQISVWEAIGRRFRRNFQYIFLLLALAWLVKIAMHPEPAATARDVVIRAAIGPMPGDVVLALGFIFNGVLFTIGWLTIQLQKASGETMAAPAPHGPFGILDVAGQVAHGLFDGRGLRLGGRHPEQVAYIITAKGDEIAQRVLHQLGRGVTALEGRGMYTGEERDVLLCAVHSDEVGELKRLVRDSDKNSFLIINPAQEIIGGGFQAPS